MMHRNIGRFIACLGRSLVVEQANLVVQGIHDLGHLLHGLEARLRDSERGVEERGREEKRERERERERGREGDEELEEGVMIPVYALFWARRAEDAVVPCPWSGGCH